MKGFKSKRGISLIVLVITIIVMIILAAAIILSISNSGIIGKATKAKQDNDVATIKEILAVYEAENAFNVEGSFIDSVSSKLEESGVTTKKVTGEHQVVTGISLDKTDVGMLLNHEVEIVVTIQQETSNSDRLFVVIGDKYYEIYTTENNLTVADYATDFENQNFEIQVEGANYVTASVNNEKQKVILTTAEKAGTDILTIKCNGKSAECNVNIKNKKAIKFYFLDDGLGEENVGPCFAEEGMTWQEFIDSEYNFYSYGDDRVYFVSEAVINPSSHYHTEGPDGCAKLTDVLVDGFKYHCGRMLCLL